MALSATVYPLYPTFDDDGQVRELLFEDVDFVSFVNHDTFGKPAIIAPGPDHVSRDDGPLSVLYVNTGGVCAVEVTRD